MNHFILTGMRHEGKTSYGFELNNMLINKGYKTGGFLSPGEFKNGERDTFYIQTISSNKKELLAKKNESGDFNFGTYAFYNKAFQTAYNEYYDSIKKYADFIFIDETGKWELSHGGFYNMLQIMPVKSSLILLCRTDFEKDINLLFFNNKAEIINIHTSILESAEIIINKRA